MTMLEPDAMPGKHCWKFFIAMLVKQRASVNLQDGNAPSFI